MSGWDMCRAVGTGLLVVGLAFQSSPVVWAQWETVERVDPALAAGVEALVTNDPACLRDPELADTIRDVAEATLVNPVERAAVTNEVVALEREGIEINTVIPPEVRDAAREKFTEVQTKMQAELETLRATDPGAAKELELRIQEGERCILAFETGERYVPSPEMVTHAREMFTEWETFATEQGTPKEFLEMARGQFEHWSVGGEMMGMMGGPGHGPGEMPTLEQMQTMGMTPEQIQMAEAYARGEMPAGMGPGPFEAYAPSFEQLQQEFGAYAPTFEQYTDAYQQFEQQYTEQFVTEYNYTPPENQTYDTQQQQLFDQYQPPSGTEVQHTLVDLDGPSGDTYTTPAGRVHTDLEGIGPHMGSP